MANLEVIFKVVTDTLGDDAFEDFRDNYETRLLVQKTMYVYQEAAKKDLFNYSWYIAGPYSSLIAEVVYKALLPALVNRKSDLLSLEFSEKGKEYMQKVKSYLNYTAEENDDLHLSKPQFYELMASMLYWHKFSKSQDDVRKKLIESKGSKYSQSTISNLVNRYWSKLEELLA